MISLRLEHVEGRFAVCQLPADAPLPAGAAREPFFCVTRTGDELSVVCREEHAPAGAPCERGWRCVRVAGTLDFGQVGVLAALTAPLAEAGVAVFVAGTYNTDYLFVKAEAAERAFAALRRAGHAVP